MERTRDRQRGDRDDSRGSQSGPAVSRDQDDIRWPRLGIRSFHAFLVMPAAVLFATVFTVGSMGRYSELTAAKASGQSFHRLMRPIFIAAGVTSVLAFLVGELAP